ncbi:MAG: hypothetical protein Q9167_006140 [Letrouitia subvulpina]
MSAHCLNDQVIEVQRQQKWKSKALETVKSSYILEDMQQRERLSLKPMLEWSNEMEKTITAPYDYLVSHPGKGIRKQLLAACNFWLKIDDASLTTIGRSISMLHNASLLIDDIQDDSYLRRGQPSAHTVFGVAQTINSANHMYFLAQRELMKLEKWPEMMRIFNEELLNLHRGQGMDLFWRNTMTTPTEEEYLLMISNKTGGLFRLAIRLMQAASTTAVDLAPLADTLGLLFQIQDDYLNLTSETMGAAKGYCEDLEEGKFSFPVIHAIHNDPNGADFILETLRKRPRDGASKTRAVTYMGEVTKSLQYTRDTVSDLVYQMERIVREYEPQNVAFDEILARIVQ